MTVNSIQTAKELIEEMLMDGTGVGSAWEFTCAMNGERMFAVFARSAYCDIYESPGVKEPKQIWGDGKYLGEYENLNNKEATAASERSAAK